MAGIDNLYIQQVKKEMEEAFENGFWKGLEDKGKFLPPFYYKKVIDLKPSERGYLLGMLVQQVERTTSIEETEKRLDTVGATGIPDSCAAGWDD